MAYIGFNKLKNKLAGKPGVSNPAGLAAAIGRKKYGKKNMAKMSKTGKTAPQLGLADVSKAAKKASLHS